MDWTALVNSKLWQEFLNSEELAARKEALQNTLVRGRFDELTRGEIRGQIKFIEGLRAFAQAQAARENALIQRSESVPEELESSWSRAVAEIR